MGEKGRLLMLIGVEDVIGEIELVLDCHKVFDI